MKLLHSKRRIVLATLVSGAALALVLVGTANALGFGPIFTTLPAGAVPTCTTALDSSIPYRIREPAVIPTGLSAERCEVASTPGSSFVRRTQFFSAADRGWISLTIAPRGATVSLANAQTTRQLTIGSATATMGIIGRGDAQIEGMYWDDSDVAIVINAMLSPTVTPDLVERLARSVRQR